MTLILFFQIFFVCLLGAISPGPSMVVVINNAVFKNRYHGIMTSIGHGIGISVYAIFAVIGIGLIIEANIIVFNSIKLISIAFLFYLGVTSLRNNQKIQFNKKELNRGITSFLQGFSISILNPKIFAWFVAFYSQFMSASNDIKFNIYLVLIAGIVDSCWYIILTLSVTSGMSLAFIKSRSANLQKIIGYLFLIISAFLLINFYLKEFGAI
jgi:threonine/homoserine/homoserine lactone efflux protein